MKNANRPNKHSGIAATPRRTASRMEGVVKNAGTRAARKLPKK